MYDWTIISVFNHTVTLLIPNPGALRWSWDDVKPRFCSVRSSSSLDPCSLRDGPRACRRTAARFLLDFRTASHGSYYIVNRLSAGNVASIVRRLTSRGQPSHTHWWMELDQFSNSLWFHYLEKAQCKINPCFLWFFFACLSTPVTTTDTVPRDCRL
jgi:hypothetical protein